jgi:hypothetical protein
MTSRRRRRGNGNGADVSSSEAGGTRTSGPSVPRQREGRRVGVVVVVVSSDHAVNTVLAGAKLAAETGQPLALVVFASPDRSSRSGMVAVDRALTVARTAFPGLAVQMHLGLTDAVGWERALPSHASRVFVDSVMASRWQGRNDELPLTVVEEPR